jgi:hypothetical protein
MTKVHICTMGRFYIGGDTCAQAEVGWICLREGFDVHIRVTAIHSASVETVA